MGMKTHWHWHGEQRNHFADLDLRNVSHPRLSAIVADDPDDDEKADPNHAHIMLSWGNGNNDPVWDIGWTMWVPKVIGGRLWR